MISLIIAGHERSGTTLLQKLCNGHPHMQITREFGNIDCREFNYSVYMLYIFRRLYQKGNSRYFDTNLTGAPSLVANCFFVNRYLKNVRKAQLQLSATRVDVPTIIQALHYTFPGYDIVGDKLPKYIFDLEGFVHVENMVRVIIYRDCRDVTSSALTRVQTKWSRTNPRFAKQVNTVEKVAHRWVKTIEIMEKYEPYLHIIRYEDLIQQPTSVLQGLAQTLGIAPDGFPIEIISPDSIGKHKSHLSSAQMDNILKIAGPTMEKYGYL